MSDNAVHNDAMKLIVSRLEHTVYALKSSLLLFRACVAYEVEAKNRYVQTTPYYS
jgi:hypothetical protein